MSTTEMSKDEKKMYDRQIRVWGLEAQTNLRNTSVLIIGCGLLCAETSKNIVLAGIRRIELMATDNSRTVEKNDIETIFFLKEEDLGKKLTIAFREYLKRLNPNVSVTISENEFSSVDEMYFKQFDVFCCTETTLTTQLYLNEIARSQSKPFFSGDLFGKSGCLFVDLGKDFSFKMKNLSKKMEFVSISESLMVNSNCFKKRQLKEKLFFAVLKSLYILEAEKGKVPVLEDTTKLIENVTKEVKTDFKEISEFVRKFLEDCEFVCAATAAVMGGAMSQEIIKFVSRNAQPFKNWMFFGEVLGGSATVVDISK